MRTAASNSFIFSRICSSDGTVNLIGSGRDTAHEGRSHEGLYPSGHAGDLGPGLEGPGPSGSILAARYWGGGGGGGGGGEKVFVVVWGGGEGAGLAAELYRLFLCP